jgi:hypothetical protein
MTRVYGVDRVDDSEMYFHVTSHARTHGARGAYKRTVHLHIGCTRVRSPDCLENSYVLNDVMTQLEATGCFVAPPRLVVFDTVAIGITDNSNCSATDDQPCAFVSTAAAGLSGTGGRPPLGESTEPTLCADGMEGAPGAGAAGSQFSIHVAGGEVDIDQQMGAGRLGLTAAALAAAQEWPSKRLLEEYLFQLRLHRAGALTQEQIDASPFSRLMCAVVASEASARAGLARAQRAASS